MKKTALLSIKHDNPHYWGMLIAGSPRYSEGEIVETLLSVEAFNEKWDEFVSVIWDTVLTWQDNGEYMGGFGGYESDAHSSIADALRDGGPVGASFSYAGHNSLPVRRWQKEVKNGERRIKSIRKMIENL